MMRGVDLVQLHGWTPEAVTRATITLSEIVASSNPDSNADRHALAVEMVRWLQCAARTNPSDLAACIEDLRPSDGDASSWDQLEALLASEKDITSLMSRLLAREADPASTLCLLLSERVSPDEQYIDLDPRYARAVEALLRFGTDRSIEYLMTNVGLLCWETNDHLKRLIAPHRDAFAATAVKVWPVLGWCDRATILELMSECDISADGVLPLLLNTDDRSLAYDDRYHFVRALLAHVPFAFDMRLGEVVRRVIARSLDDPSEEARNFVAFARQELAEAMESETSAIAP
jgi:hypothetical protein